MPVDHSALSRAQEQSTSETWTLYTKEGKARATRKPKTA